MAKKEMQQRTSGMIPPELRLSLGPSLKKRIISELTGATLRAAINKLRQAFAMATTGEYNKALGLSLEVIAYASAAHKKNPDLAARVIGSAMFLVLQILRTAKTVQELQGLGLKI